MLIMVPMPPYHTPFGVFDLSPVYWLYWGIYTIPLRNCDLLSVRRISSTSCVQQVKQVYLAVLPVAARTTIKVRNHAHYPTMAVLLG